MDNSNLEKLLKVLLDKGIESFLVPSTDEFLSEYTPACLRRLEFISGFSGSSSTLLVRSNGKHVFFTDGRYTIQARNEISQDIQIINISEISIKDYLAKNGIKSLAYDPKLHSSIHIDVLREVVPDLKPIKNPIDEIWENRPKMPSSMPFIQNSDYIAALPQIKITDLLGKFAKIADKLLIADPESICYLLNIRGSDVPCNPIILGYMFISNSGVLDFFTYKPSRFEHIIETLALNINFHDISDLEDYISKLKGQKIAYNIPKTQDWFRTNFAKYGALSIEFDDGILLNRAVKRDNEILGARKAHILDAVAVIRAIYRIKFTPSLNEMDAGIILLEERQKHKDFISESFPSICGYGSNGAIVHYRATPKTVKNLENGNILLIDSGGHYESGTTDITRTLVIGSQINPKWKECYTLILKGHIALSAHNFDYKTVGSDLDKIARKPINDAGYDYDHGTGHGVGNLLNVHEGPFYISKRHNLQTIMPNMIISNEPGIYIEGKFGIRIENLMYSKEISPGIMGFETLTLVPYEKELINFEMLDTSEINWLKQYYKMISDTILPLIKDSNVSSWLVNQLEF